MCLSKRVEQKVLRSSIDENKDMLPDGILQAFLYSVFKPEEVNQCGLYTSVSLAQDREKDKRAN